MFLVRRHLRKRAAVALERDEHRVVAETASRPEAPSGDVPSTSPRTTTSLPSAARAIATVAKRAVRCAGSTPSSSRSSLATLSAYGRVLARVARRVDAGRTVQRVDLEAGVVGDGEQPERVGERRP